MLCERPPVGVSPHKSLSATVHLLSPSHYQRSTLLKERGI
uniref:Uncharacterized protein n=1 Tax=Anguilla anguilla TaxID=7936 RepID=A0A0E9PK09_ANGAN